MIPFSIIVLVGFAAASPLKQNVRIPLDPEDIKRFGDVMEILERGKLGDDTIITATVNDYTDKLLANIDKLMTIQKFDPMDMPDFSEKFSKFLVSGEFTLSNGVLTDASTLHREGDCVVTYNKTSKYLSIRTPMAFKSLKFEYKYKVKYMHLGPTGKVTGGVTKLKMLIKIGVDFNTYLANLDDYEITNSGHISVKFHGHFTVDWMMDMLSNMTTVGLKPIILALVEIIVEKTLVTLIDTINAIVQSILNSDDNVNMITTFFVN